MIERIIIDHVCSMRCPVNSFIDVSFAMVAYGKIVFEVQGNLATGKIRNKAEHSYFIQS